MKLILPATAIAAALMLSACGGESASHNNSANGAATEANLLEGAQETVLNAADSANSANVSDMLENQAEAVGNAAENATSSTENAAH